MSMFYGDRKLELDSVNTELLITGLYNHAKSNCIATMGGNDLTPLEDVRHLVDDGFVFLGNVDKTQLIGVGCISGLSGRIWIYSLSGETYLFIDGPGTIVEALGLSFDPYANTVYSPYNDLVLTTL